MNKPTSHDARPVPRRTYKWACLTFSGTDHTLIVARAYLRSRAAAREYAVQCVWHGYPHLIGEVVFPRKVRA
jgi:hypothetical protein